MSATTSIEWTRGDDGSAGATWNPVTGCSKVSPGCDHCYAETFAERFRGVPGHPYEQGFDLRVWPERLALPFGWRQPRRVFVNSMSDLFATGVDDSFIARVFAVMWATPRHTYQVLTKRPARMACLLGSAGWWSQVAAELRHVAAERGSPELAGAAERVPTGAVTLPNVWLGTSVESEKWARVRIPRLLATPAAIRFLSCEPLLESLDLTPWLLHSARPSPIQWVIAGGESGPGARPIHPAWAQDLAEVCGVAKIAFFYKQHGAWMPVCAADDPEADVKLSPYRSGSRRLICLLANGEVAVDGRQVQAPLDETAFWLVRLGKGRAGRELLGRTWDQFPAAAGAVMEGGTGG
jgi:protein gp37